jgi:hypothetical protein
MEILIFIMASLALCVSLVSLIALVVTNRSVKRQSYLSPLVGVVLPRDAE